MLTVVQKYSRVLTCIVQALLLMGCTLQSAPPSLDAMSCANSGPSSIVKIPPEKLFVSEPDPRMFGNPGNEPNSAGWSNRNWLKSRFHFSFAEYHDGPSNFGVLRVMNDDLVQPRRGFGEHPHRDMEIITFVVNGALTHQDSMGTRETLGRGSVQFMTAGTGVRHSEHNLDETAPLRFIQSWVVPRARGLPPNYGSMVGSTTADADRRNKWAHLVSDVKSGNATPVQINQDCNMYVTELDAGTISPPLEIRAGRQAYMLAVEGEIQITDQSLSRHDAAMLQGGLTFEAKAGKNGAMILLFEMSSALS
eukprot:TRINITY_DN83023_c0_g1_i1.p1 TRINITY_DN83023_c0_g1~~TRINITY_DN83023_c0_g1_i1.p1  ORF type:complete len:307 (-),score=54.97 TRINITY_DN83023_c0_g1_i1:437-1357(-)